MIGREHDYEYWVKQHNFEKLDFISTDKSDLAYREINGTKYWLTNHGVHSLIYPKWDITTPSPGKSASLIFSARDTWFFDIENQNPMKKNWMSGLEHLWSKVPVYWKNNKDDISSGMKACWSKEYYLE